MVNASNAMRGAIMEKDEQGVFRRHARGVFAAVLAFVLVASVSLLSGCATSGSEEAAAVVGDDIVREQDVTDYIEAYRANNAYESEGAWRGYLEDSGNDPEGVREYLTRYFARMVALKQVAESFGVELPSEVDVQVAMDAQRANYDEMADYYSGKYGINDWETYFGQVFVNEGNFRQALEADLMEERLRAKMLEGVVVEESQYVDFFAQYGAYYDATYVYRIGCESEQQAQEALSKLENGDIAWEEAVASYSVDESAKENGGLVGWSILNSSAFEVATYSVVASMEAGEFSGVYENANGQFEVYYCSETYDAPSGDEEVVVSEIPADIYESLNRKFLDDTFKQMLDEALSSIEIELCPMPEGLSYDIDMPEGGDESAGDADDKAADGGNAASNAVLDSSEASGEDSKESVPSSAEGNR